MVRYRDIDMSSTPSAGATVPSTEGSSTAEAVASRSPVGGGSANTLVHGHNHHILATRGGPNLRLQCRLGAIVSMTSRPSSTTTATTGGGSAAGSSTALATISPYSTCTGSGLAYSGWRWGSEGTTRMLNAKHFKGARLRTPVSAYLREDGTRLASKTS
jgi:hypothetical protein